MITAGGSQAVGLIVDLFVDWDDTVLMEAPTWMGFIWALKNVGAKQMAVPMQDDGMDMDALRTTLDLLRADGVTPKMIYVIPNFQNPTGISMSLEKRKQLIELAHEFGTIIFEDDAYFDLRFSGEKLPSIYALDPYGSDHLYRHVLEDHGRWDAPRMACGPRAKLWITLACSRSMAAPISSDRTWRRSGFPRISRLIW